MLLQSQQLKLFGFAVIILFCYSLSAIFQEKVLRRPYGANEKEAGERFSFAFAFAAVQAVCCAVVARGKF